jgi:hypothetical protein
MVSKREGKITPVTGRRGSQIVRPGTFNFKQVVTYCSKKKKQETAKQTA